MRPIALAVLAALTACTPPLTITERAPVVGPRRAPDRVPAASIDGAAIATVAIAERGDAAVSVDAIGEARLWPALDGTREPVTLHPLDGSRAVAIAGNGDELLAAGLDTAGNATLARVTREGALRGTAKLAGGEAAIVQLVAIDGGVLVRRSDQSIERYDAGGGLRSRLVGDPGERLGAIAARRGAAIAFVLGPRPPQFAGLTGDFSFAAGVRAIALDGGGLAWGEQHALPDAVVTHTIRGDALALSPNHTRIAVMDFSSTMYVLDATDLHEIGHASASATVPVLGFTDDDDAVEIGAVTGWWRAHGEQLASFATAAGGAVGDGLAIAPMARMLGLVEPEHVSYLGWGKVPDSELLVAGAHLAVMAPMGFDKNPFGNSFGTTRGLVRFGDGPALASDEATSAILLDDGLQVWQTRSVPGTPVVWIDERYVVCLMPGGSRYVLVDLEVPGHDIELGSHVAIAPVTYDRALHELAFYETSDVNRYAFDAQLGTVKELPSLQAFGGRPVVQLVDPATHDGVVAYQMLAGSNMIEWHDGSGAEDLPEPVPAASGPCITLDLNRDYMLGPNGIVGLENANVCLPKLAFEVPMHVVGREDGARMAAFDGHTFAMYDAAGSRLWQRDLWDVHTVAFSPDRQTVVAATAGGLVALDVDTGERVGSRCAFEFGIHEEPSTTVSAAANAPTECEE